MTDFLNDIKDEALQDLDQFFDEDIPETNSKGKDKSSGKVLITYTDDRRLIDTLFD